MARLPSIDNSGKPEHPQAGAWAALLSAVAFGLTTTAARFAYEGGTTTESVVLLRLLVTVPIFFATAWFLKHALALPKPFWFRTMVAGCGMLGTSFCLLSAVQYINVGQAVLVLYTWPLVLIAAMAVRDRRLPDFRTALGFLAAFGGLVMALDLTTMDINPIGIGLAFLAGVCNVAVFIASTPVLKSISSMAYAAWTNLIGLPLLFLMLPVLGAIVLPQTAVGWSGFVGVSALYLIAMMALFAAIQRGGEQKTALLFNLEPLIAIAAGWALLGETMTAWQLTGAAIVVMALYVTRQRA